MGCCVTPHALLSALVARMRGGGPAASADELRAIVASGGPRADVEAALAREQGEPFERARAVLAATDTPERRRAPT